MPRCEAGEGSGETPSCFLKALGPGAGLGRAADRVRKPGRMWGQGNSSSLQTVRKKQNHVLTYSTKFLLCVSIPPKWQNLNLVLQFVYVPDVKTWAEGLGPSAA